MTTTLGEGGAPRAGLLRRCALILVVPALLWGWLQLERVASGPFYMQSKQDPSYRYLLNFALLAQGQPVGFIHHPGVPLQVLGAIALRVGGAGEAGQSLGNAVLEDPEGHLLIVYETLGGVWAFSLIVAGFLALRVGLEPGLIVLLQASALASPRVLGAAEKVAPEMLLLGLEALLAGLILHHVLGRDPSGRVLALWGGVVFGVGLATKLTFVPVAGLLLVSLPDARERLRCLAATFVAFWLAMLPAWPCIGRLFSWWGTLAQPNLYRKAAVDFPGPVERLRSLVAGLLEGEWFWLAALGIAALVLVLRWKDAGDGRVRLALIGCLAAHALNLLLALRDPQVAQRYLVPALGLAGLTAVLALIEIEQAAPWHRSALRPLAVLLLVGAALPRLAAMWPHLEGARLESARLLDFVARAEARAPACQVIPFDRIPSPVFALADGARWADGHFDAELAELYPDFRWFVASRRGRLKRFGAELPDAVEPGSDDCVLLLGYEANLPSTAATGLRRELIEREPPLALFRVFLDPTPAAGTAATEEERASAPSDRLGLGR